MTMLLKNRALLLLIFFGITGLWGCNLSELTPPSSVIRARIAGIRATPAEISLGESTQLDALFVQPAGDDSEWGALWFSCVEAGGATGCLGGGDFLGDLGGQPPGDDDDSAEEPRDPRDFQFSADASFVYTAHGTVIEEAWELLSPAERVEGLVVLVSVNYVPVSQEALQELFLRVTFGPQNGTPEDAEAAAEELGELIENGINAARRIVVSDKSADTPAAIDCPVSELLPNSNPNIEGMLLHLDEEGKDQGLPMGPVTFVNPEDILVLRPVFREGAIEDYLYITTQGDTECRQESPYFGWLSNMGSMAADYSFFAEEGDLDEIAGKLKINRLVMPPADQLAPSGDLWLVARDRRGGIDWMHFNLERGLALEGR
ncbi:MAG: hypothetical protein CMP23_02565 [Rickettsiales bacterium]|nr:hypothetical protein [Rickettsiales bacterium]|tara:strand:+ start:376 stop:1497 length:1122 start_codon:yes stop_codon:yes gene_type:complete